MALDEIVQTCPVPLPAWLADSGGKGIQLIPVAHGEAQLRTRWGKDGAQVVLDTCGVKVWLPGITDTATLKMASELCGQAAFTERIRSRSRDGLPRGAAADLARRDDARHDPPASRRPRAWSSAAATPRSSPGSAPRGKTPPTRRARRSGHRRRPAHPRRPRTSRQPCRHRARHAQPARRLRAVPDLDVEAAGEARGDDSPAYPWS